ncbi:uroporphyrinogen-III synthase [Lichenihabitans sp. PAMC28606]|nr:uroporphyrinogen-III synthase [Lichenihabitans sp. PAMC28606]
MRVLLCRPHRDSEATTRLLAANGHTSRIAPVIEIVPLAFDETSVGTVDALVLTSAHAAQVLRSDVVARWAGHPVYTVGQATGTAATRAGFHDVRIGGGDAASLISLLQLTLPAPRRLVYLAGHVRKPTLEATLKPERYTVGVVEVYDARETEGWDAHVVADLGSGSINGVMHFSRRSAALALDYATRAGVGDAFRQLPHFCISLDVADVLSETGVDTVTTAASPSEDALLRLIPAA